VLYFVDVSEQCGYSPEEQSALYFSIRALFADKQLVIVANKTDVRSLESLSDEHKALLENMAAAHATNGPQADQRAPVLQMSNVTERGVDDVKNAACDFL